MRARLRDERGSALLAAIVLLGVMLMIGLASASLGDTQEREAGRERLRHASLSVSEAALEAQVLRLTRSWPATSAAAYPAACTPGSVGVGLRCPDAALLAQSFAGADAQNPACGGTGALWSTTVRDNGATIGRFYRSSVAATQPAWDANGDGLLWVRADGRSQCRLRSVVMMVRAFTVQVPFPRLTLGANWFATANNGRKVLVDTKGGTTIQPAPVQVRCVMPHPTPCASFSPQLGQVSGSTVQTATGGSPALKPDAYELLKARAVSLGSYYAAGTCPPSLTGPLVVVESLVGCPGYGSANTAAAPGMLIVGRGAFVLGGNSEFHGLVYHRNLDNSQGAMIETRGSARIVGGVAVDGLGGVTVGSSGENIVFDQRTTSLVRGIGDATPVSGTWREISPVE